MELDLFIFILEKTIIFNVERENKYQLFRILQNRLPTSSTRLQFDYILSDNLREKCLDLNIKGSIK
jgi:hypothetical protein